MLNAGNNTGIIKNTFSDLVNLRFGTENIIVLFVSYAIIANTVNARLNAINSGIVANGVS
jgi:hypothetical protein